MVRSTPAVKIEEEPTHEIYASLVASSFAADHSTAVAREASHAASDRANGPLHRHAATSMRTSESNQIDRDNGQMRSIESVVIATEDEDLPTASSTSQFVQFYHKSCRESKRQSLEQDLGRGRSDPVKISQTKNNLRFYSKPMKSQSAMCHNRNNSSQAHATRTTTKAERRRIMRRERERQIVKDKQISIMLRSDVSDEYSSLYKQFHR
ncbi:hypothetical protein ACHAW6_009635 [Cyclotella cf. meneghiniana]